MENLQKIILLDVCNCLMILVRSPKSYLMLSNFLRNYRTINKFKLQKIEIINFAVKLELSYMYLSLHFFVCLSYNNGG